MHATPLPAPTERSDAPSRATAPEPAALQRENGRFADLLRQRRADAAQGGGRTAPSPTDEAQAGDSVTATTSATSAAVGPRARPATARDAKEDEATRAEPACRAASEEIQTAAPVPLGTGEPAANDLATPPSTGDAGVPIAVPAQVDAQAPRTDVPPTASGPATVSRPGRVVAKAEADVADAAQRAATATGTAQEAPATAASTTLLPTAEPNRAPLLSRVIDASPAAGAVLPPSRHAELALPAPTSVALSAPVASPEFGELLGAQVSLFARDGLQQAELRLNPAEMGPIGVQIDIAGSEARINFNAGQATTRDAIERALPELAAALRGEGLTLAGGGVFDRPPGAREGTSARASPGTRRTGGVGAPALPATVPRGFAPQGAVDLYA